MKDKYAVLGNPIEHSLSPEIHNHFAEQMKQNLRYEKICVALDEFNKVIMHLQNEGYKGLNITVPFKQQAYELCDEVSVRAKQAGAVNTILFKGKKYILGDNTDGIGLIRDIEQNLKISLTNKKILIVGAGGAARGIIQPILEKQPQKLILSNRTLAKAQELAMLFKQAIKAQSFAQLKPEFDVIINATSLGLTDEEFPVSAEIVQHAQLCYDLMYGKETCFMQWAKQNKVPLISDGLGMLVEQAAESFYLWRGARPDTHAVIQRFRKSEFT